MPTKHEKPFPRYYTVALSEAVKFATRTLILFSGAIRPLHSRLKSFRKGKEKEGEGGEILEGVLEREGEREGVFWKWNGRERAWGEEEG